jgi:16S rRNA G1207 methylase RsmC
VEGAAQRLSPGGLLRLVVQRRHAVGERMRMGLRGVRPVADGGPYRVWEGRP